jgi:hypothetical protein
MWRFSRASVGADPHRQFSKHLWFSGEQHHGQTRVDLPQAELEDTATRPPLIAVLEIAVAAATCAGTILALFAWSGAAL